MRTAGKILSVILIVSLCLAPFSVSGKKEVKIAFLDSGVSLKHIDPEKVLPGENLVFPESDTSDRIGHGTLAAGIVTGSEELSLPGVSDGAVIVPIVCYDAYPSGVHEKGDGKMLAEGIYKAIDKYDCDIINLSMGITSDDEELKKAVEYAEEKNVVIVAAAGNSNLEDPERVYYPARYDTVISVGSADGDEAAAFSQRGKVDVLAQKSFLSVPNKNSKRLITATGTSYSAAYISGVCANIIVENGTLPAAKVREKLYSLAVPLRSGGSTHGVVDSRRETAKMMTKRLIALIKESSGY